MSEISRRNLLAGAAFTPLAAADYRIVDLHGHVWSVDLDIARQGPRESYRRCGRYVMEKLEPVYV
jgi:hypothetical protein